MPMKNVLDDLLGHMNANFQSLLGVEFEILWYVLQPLFFGDTISTNLQGLKSHCLPMRAPMLAFLLNTSE